MPRAQQWAKLRREMGRSIGSFVLAATPEGRSTAAGCTLESGRLLSGHMYLGGAGAKCKRATLLAAAAAHGCSREACGEGKQSRHAPFLSNLAAQILGLVEPGELHLQWAASSLGAGAPAQPQGGGASLKCDEPASQNQPDYFKPSST